MKPARARGIAIAPRCQVDLLVTSPTDVELALARRLAVTVGLTVLLALTDAVSIWSGTAGHWSTAVRAAIIMVSGAALLGLVTAIACRRIGVAVTVALASQAVLTGSSIIALGASVSAVWALVAYWRWVRRRIASPYPTAASIALASALGATTLGMALSGGAIVDGDLAWPAAPKAVAAGDEHPPSIYVLLLDGYPRADTLASEFGYDNRPFIDAMGELGFTDYPDALSPATRTELSLLSMLGGEVDGSLPPSFEPSVSERRTIRARIRSAPGRRALTEAGYRLVHIPSPVVHMTFVGWDRVVDSGHLNEIETAMIQRSSLAPLLAGWVFEQHRERIDASFATLAEEAAKPQAKVVLAHILAPHPPLVFGSTDRVPLECWARSECSMLEGRRNRLGLTEAEYERQVIAQVKATNERTLSAIRLVVERDPDAVVLVLSDHGLRHDDDSEEWRRALLLARGTTLFTDAPSATDLFRRLIADEGAQR